MNFDMTKANDRVECYILIETTKRLGFKVNTDAALFMDERHLGLLSL